MSLLLTITIASFVLENVRSKVNLDNRQAKKKMLLQLPPTSETPPAPKNKPTVTYIKEDLWKSNNVVSFVVECLVLIEHLQGARKKTASLHENQL